MFLDIIIADPTIINRAGFDFTIKDMLIHIVVETLATIIIEGIIFALFCKEVKFRKVALINAITCICIHIIYYILAKNVFTDMLFPLHPTFQSIVTRLLTGHILLITILEVAIFIIEYIFYVVSCVKEKNEATSSLKKKIFIVSLLANFVAFFIGVLISASIVMLLLR